jgi:putative addiction module component (TIGR02574 family)
MKVMTLDQIKALSISERIQLAEDIWDTVVAEDADIELTEGQRGELDRRLVAYEQDPGRGSSWEEVRARILGLRA